MKENEEICNERRKRWIRGMFKTNTDLLYARHETGMSPKLYKISQISARKAG